MSQGSGTETEGLVRRVDEGGVGIVRMVVGEGGERQQRVHPSDGVEPGGQGGGMVFLPSFDAHDLPDFPEERAIQHGVHQVVVALIQFVHQLVQAEDGVRGAAALLLDVPQERCLQRLAVHQAEQAGVGAQYLEFLAVDVLHLGDFAGEEETEYHEGYPQGAPVGCRHHPCQDEQQAERIGTAYHVGQEA